MFFHDENVTDIMEQFVESNDMGKNKKEHGSLFSFFLLINTSLLLWQFLIEDDMGNV